MAEIDGKQIAHRILDRAKRKVERLHVRPTLAVVMVGNNAASAKYVEKKSQAAEYVGIDFYLHRFPDTVTNQQLADEVELLQMRNDAVIIQLPLPKNIDARSVLDKIALHKDADCLSSAAIGSTVRGGALVQAPTAGAIIEILNTIKINLKGKHVVIVGQGELIGKPAAAMFLNEAVTLTVCGLGTKKLSDFTKLADILITGVGKANLIKGDMVKKGVVVIDAGTSFVKGKIHGDVDYASVAKKARFVTPTPGGVGPITVAMLLENVVNLASR